MKQPSLMEARHLLRSMFDAAIAAAQPSRCLPPYLPPKPRGRTVVVGAGKASAEMARVVEQHWDGELSGLVVTRYGHGVPCRRIEIVSAAHPVPDEAGLQAATRMLKMVQGLGPDDLVLCLISGGGSALLPLPASGISFEDKQVLNRALLKSGASISEMNCVRRHLSAIKGGRLAGHETHIITNPQAALEAAASVGLGAGIPVHILGNAIEGEARDVGKVMAGITQQILRHDQPFRAPCILLSGGETTVTVRGQGEGGRNVEFLLSLAIALNGERRVHAIAGDTDGADGRQEIAGAIAGPDTLARAWKLGRRPADSLAQNDGHGFFGALGDAVVTGPTLTNVNDFRAILITGR